MNMKAIVNISPQWGIGTENRLLVRIKDDMRRFRALTTNQTIVIGRKTLETFPNQKPLPNRTNIVLTRDRSYCADGAVVCHDLSELKTAIDRVGSESVYVCGGEQIYRLLLPFCDTALITLTDTDAKADRFFPNLNRMPNWILTDAGEKQSENDLTFRYLTYRNTDPKQL